MKGLGCIVVLLYGCGINPVYKTLAPEKKLVCTPANISDSLKADSIYSLTFAEFKKMVSQSSKPYHLYISYTYWCPAAKTSLPTLFSLDSTNNLQTYFVTPDDWYYLNYYKDYLYWKKYHKPTFILDIRRYGNRFNPHKRFDKFKLEFCPDCKEVAGFPSFLLFDKNCNLIFKYSGQFNDSTVNLLKQQLN